MKRINLQIDRITAEAFTHKAEKSGMSKSYLLRQWISNLQLINFQHIPNIKTRNCVSYTIRLPADLLAEIDDLAKNKGLFRAEFLRAMIHFKLNQTNDLSYIDSNNQTYIDNLWKEGRVDKVNDYIQSKFSINDLTENELLIGIRNSNETGRYQLSKELITELEMRRNKIDDGGMLVKFMNIDLHIMQRNYHQVEYELRSIEMEVLSSLSRQIQGKYYMYAGELKFYKDDLIASRNNFFRALALLDSINHPLDIIRIYMRLGRVEECLMNFDMAQSYFNYAYQIAKQLNNKHCLGWFYNDYAFHFYLRNELDKADKYIQISNRYYSSVKNMKGLSYNNDHQGRFLIQRNDYINSQKYLNKACNFVDKYVVESYFNYSNLFRLFIKSKNQYKLVEVDLRQKLLKHKGIKPGLGKYMYETIRYIHSNNSVVRQDAGTKLEFMQTNANYPLIKNAARHTLIIRKLAPVR